MSWHPESWNEICKRASGRRHYNSVRTQQANLRRYEIREHLRTHGSYHGIQKALAARYKVSPATISKDMAAITQSAVRCSSCGRYREKIEMYLEGRKPKPVL